MSIDHVNYVDTYFEYKKLSKIHTEPTYDSLKKIKDELKANATAVSSDLGGGFHGHLGLVLQPEEYLRVSNTPYVRPEHPGELDVPLGTPQHESHRLRAEHKEAIRLFRETTDVEKALRYQITSAIPKEYLDSLRNREANAITLSIPDILDYLFQNYGTVEQEEVTKEEQIVREFKYNPPTPLVVIFNRIEDLRDLAEAALNPYTDLQLLNIGLQVLKDSGSFTEGLKLWYELPQDQHNWDNFKQHFQEELRKLKKVLGPTMKHTGFQTVNQITEEVRKEMNDMKKEFNNVEDKILQAVATNNAMLQDIATNESYYHENDHEEQAYNTVQHNNNTELMKMLQTLQQDLHNVKMQMTTTPNPHPQQPFPPQQQYTPPPWGTNTGRGQGGRGRGGRSGRGRGRQQLQRKNTRYYCWTHGACAHTSQFCNYPAEGHQKEATFANTMGGSTNFCNQNHNSK
jgi:hypothetical protein